MCQMPMRRGKNHSILHYTEFPFLELFPRSIYGVWEIRNTWFFPTVNCPCPDPFVDPPLLQYPLKVQSRRKNNE